MLATIVLPLLLVAGVNGRPAPDAARMAQLWQAPSDLTRRNLLLGPGGRTYLPDRNGRYHFVDIKRGGTQPGYEVIDDRDRHWNVKQGVEARTEVVVSRLVWAVGYHQPYVYYLPQWKLTRDGRTTLQPGGRFRLETPVQRKIDSWSWRRNPFLGTRPMSALFVLMVLVNNFDLRTEQNTVYEVSDGDQDSVLRYMVRDLGAAFGKTIWPSFLGTKDDLEEYEREPFIRGIKGGRVQFHYEGAWREPQLHNSVTPDDVRWICDLLNRLSDQQWESAFRAGGFDDRETARYVRRLKERIREGLSLRKASSGCYAPDSARDF